MGFAQGHTLSKWQSQASNLGPVAPAFVLSPLYSSESLGRAVPWSTDRWTTGMRGSVIKSAPQTSNPHPPPPNPAAAPSLEPSQILLHGQTDAHTSPQHFILPLLVQNVLVMTVRVSPPPDHWLLESRTWVSAGARLLEHLAKHLVYGRYSTKVWMVEQKDRVVNPFESPMSFCNGKY